MSQCGLGRSPSRQTTNDLVHTGVKECTSFGQQFLLIFLRTNVQIHVSDPIPHRAAPCEELFPRSTRHYCPTVHAEAGESSSVVEARAVVLTRTRRALVDVRLAPVAGVASCTGTPERARRVDARTSVLTRRQPACNASRPTRTLNIIDWLSKV